MNKQIHPVDIFKDVVNGNINEEDFMTWYNSEMAKAHSRGFKEGSDHEYFNGSDF